MLKLKILDYVKLNSTDPEKSLLQVDYMQLLPYFDKIYDKVYQGDVLYITYPFMEPKYVELSRQYYMEGVADMTEFVMNTIYDIRIDRHEHKFMKERPIDIDTGQTSIISGEARAGKSSLALWIAYSLYADWDVAIAHIVIDPLQLDDLIEAMKAYGIRKIPLVIIDDAGIGFGKQIGKIDRIRLDKIHKYAQTWAIKFNNVLLTIPSETRLSGVLMKAMPSSYAITVKPLTMATSEVHVYKNVIRLDGKLLKVKHNLREYRTIRGLGVMLRKKLQDFSHIVYTPRLIPNDAYEKYRKLREDYLYIIAKM